MKKRIFQMGKMNDKVYEDLLAAQLDAAGIEYEREYLFHPKRKWRSDFFIPEHNLLVEVDGILYSGYGGHQTGAGFQSDVFKHNESAKLGYHTLRFTPAMVNGKAKDTLKDKPLIEPAIDTILKFIEAKRLNFVQENEK